MYQSEMGEYNYLMINDKGWESIIDQREKGGRNIMYV